MHYVLTVLIFTVYQGHGLADASYRDRLEFGPFQTEDDCLHAVPHVRFDSFPRPEDLSYDLHQVKCVKVPDTKESK